MVKPIEIALAAHEICVNELIPKKISPQHDESKHLDTSAYYAYYFNDRGMGNLTGKEIVDAIIEAAKWDKDSTWFGHPEPSLVVKYFEDKRHKIHSDTDSGA